MFGTKESFIYLRNLALKLNISCAEKSTNRFGSFAYTVFTKSLICSDTLFNLIYPVPRLIEGISKSPMVIYDLSSTFVLIRSLFESYVNTCYILLNNESDEQKELKFLLWQRHSRKERQRMAEFRNLRHSIIDKEKNEIELLNQAILQNKYYLILSEKKKAHFLNENNWTDLNTTDRAIQCGISENKTRFIYKFLSSYAHSESFSNTVFDTVSSSNNAKKLIEELPLSLTEGFLCLISGLIKPYFKEAQELLLNENDFDKMTDFWKNYLKK